MRRGCFRTGALAVLLAGAAWGSGARLDGAPGELLLDHVALATIAPQDITYDTREDCFWVTSFLDNRIHKYSADLRRELEAIPSPFDFFAFQFQTGIAYNSCDDTLLIANAGSATVIEILKDGTPTGREVLIPVPAGSTRAMTVRSIVYNPPNADTGDCLSGGSIWVVDSGRPAFYEVSLDGTLLRELPHPEDEDGLEGNEGRANAAGFDVLRQNGKVLGFYVTGVQSGEHRILKIDSDGRYTGVAMSLNATGGSVSSILRHRFPDPETGELTDGFICVVESNARLAVIRADEPELREIFALGCRSDAGAITLSWTSRQTYDRIEVLESCEILAVLPGDRDAWEWRDPDPGVHRLRVRAVRGQEASEVGPCVAVAGAGRILGLTRLEVDTPIDTAWVSGYLLVSDARNRKLLAFTTDPEITYAGDVPLALEFVPEREFITGVSRGPDPDTLLVYNTTRHLLGTTDLAGDVWSIVPVGLPNIDEDFDPEDPDAEPDLGVVLGMAFDPAAIGGEGAVWLVEGVRDVLYQVDLQGNVVRSLPHPYHELEAPPLQDIFAVYTSGISVVPGEPGLLCVTGGTFRDLRQRWAGLVEIETGRIVPGSEISLEAVYDRTSARNFAIEHAGAGGARLFILGLAGTRSVLAEIDSAPAVAPVPRLLRCRQPTHANDVLLEFRNTGPYDAIEVLRDCEIVARIEGELGSYVDRDVPPGVHDYAVRGVQDGHRGEPARSSLRTGAGAVLSRGFTYPARSPQQVARDPVDGSFYVSVNWRGDERTLYHFDPSFRFLGERLSTIRPDHQIATLAVRAPPGEERLLYSISWFQPVPLGEADRQRFYLVSETLAGEPVAEVEISPPRPQGQFLTFPTALAWEPASDTFFYLERNTRTFVRMLPDGTELYRFPHPSPPFQNFVFNLGLSVWEDALFFTTSLGHEHQITRIRAMDFAGTLLEHEIPLDDAGIEVRDFELVAGEVVAVGSGSFSELVRLKAFPEVPQPFVRGDADSDGAVRLTDAIVLLSHLFRRGPPPLCPDAADADDDGFLLLTDAIAILVHLFAGQAALPPPYPEPGQDTTLDSMACPPREGA